jgi:hypothetical protein
MGVAVLYAAGGALSAGERHAIRGALPFHGAVEPATEGRS